MDDKIKIQVKLINKNYPVTIKRSEEAKVRKATIKVNSKFDDCKKQYPDMEQDDLLAMVAFDLALECVK